MMVMTTGRRRWNACIVPRMHAEREERQHARHQPAVVRGGEGNDVGGLPERGEDRPGQQVIERDRDREHHREQQGPLKGAYRRGTITRADGLVDQRIERRAVRPGRRKFL